MARVFIQEVINNLRSGADEIEEIWKEFKAGQMTKESFEEEYTHLLQCRLSEFERESYRPNNNCKYQDTNPESKYFKDSNI